MTDAEKLREEMLTDALLNALRELTNVHQEMLLRTAGAPTGCPCTSDAIYRCPVESVIYEGMQVLGMTDYYGDITSGVRMLARK